MLLITPMSDRRVWLHASDGNLSAKLAFQFLHPSPDKLDWASTIWRPCIPLLHSFVFWRLMWSKLPTDENLQKRGCTLVFICGLCYKHAESSWHLFLSCDFAVAVRRCIGLKLNRSMSLTSVHNLLDCIHVRCSSQVRDVIMAAIVHVVYCIWLTRNAFRFNSVAASLHATMAKIASYVAILGMHSNGNCISLDVDILNNFLIPPLFRRVKEIVSVVWKAPTITWVKANTNGSVVNLNASCGGIFRDFRGTFLGCFASNISSWSVFEAELMDLILAMEFAAGNHWNRLWLECDSSSVVHAFKNNIIIPIRLRNRRHNCFQHGMTIICSHVFREGNCCADKLASLCHVVTNTIWYTTMPSSLADDFTRDRNGPCA